MAPLVARWMVSSTARMICLRAATRRWAAASVAGAGRGSLTARARATVRRMARAMRSKGMVGSGCGSALRRRLRPFGLGVDEAGEVDALVDEFVQDCAIVLGVRRGFLAGVVGWLCLDGLGGHERIKNI